MVKAAKDFAGHLQLTIGLLKKGTFLFTKNLRWSAMACAYAKPLAEVERSYILQVLRDCYGNRTRAAKLLGISIRGFASNCPATQRRGF